MLCTGSFPAFRAHVPLIMLDQLLAGFVNSVAPRGRLGILTPDQRQISNTKRRWRRAQRAVKIEAASPYDGMEPVLQAARKLASAVPDIVILDCIGFTCAMKQNVKEIVQKPVILPRSVLAKTISELAV